MKTLTAGSGSLAEISEDTDETVSAACKSEPGDGPAPRYSEERGGGMAGKRPIPRRKRKQHSAVYGLLSVIVICAALVFGMSVFFRVSSITVVGNTLYTADEIIDASGMEEGDNLFFVNRFTAVSKIFAKLPYIEEASVTRSLPNKIVIEVSESSAVAFLTVENKLWIINSGCKLLGMAESGEEKGLIRVDGLTPINPSAGEGVAAGETEKSKIAYLSAILGEIEERGIGGDIRKLDISDVSNPSFDFLGRFTVYLGRNDRDENNTEYKFGLLLSAVKQLAPGDTGTIDLSMDSRAHFTPD